MLVLLLVRLENPLVDSASTGQHRCNISAGTKASWIPVPSPQGASGSDSVDVDNQWCHINAYKRPMRVCLGRQAIMGSGSWISTAVQQAGQDLLQAPSASGNSTSPKVTDGGPQTTSAAAHTLLAGPLCCLLTITSVGWQEQLSGANPSFQVV
jgi:hypothetical protein